MTSTLLSHLTSRFVTQAENLATESLSYMLQTYPEAVQAFTQFVDALALGLPRELWFDTQHWLKDDQAIPDLVGVTAGGEQPLIVEAKFWASLTGNQPVTYLRRLPAGQPGLLLFVAPDVRATYLWDELVRRCMDAGLAIEPSTSVGESRVAAVGCHMLALTSWRQVLGALEVTFQNTHRVDALADLGQLQGVCDQQDADAFLPLTSEELTSDIGRRVNQIGALIGEATTALVAEKVADITRLTWSGWSWDQASRQVSAGFGRYLRLGPWEALLHVNSDRWARHRATPTWLRITDTRAAGHRALVDALAPLRHATPPRLIGDNNLLMMPIYLDAGADRDAALAQILTQLREIHALISPVQP